MKNDKVVKFLYESSGTPLAQADEAAKAINNFQKAFVLACRILGNNYCPAEAYNDIDTKNCPDNCGLPESNESEWNCWQKKILDEVESEQVCRVCGCTQDNACPGGCYWVEEDLCSKCVERSGDV